MAAAADASQYECGICCNLLLEPVVGRCGHDFCRGCLERWRSSQHQLGRPFACPMCRSLLGSPGEPLGVCVRLRDTLQLLFPDKVKERMREAQEQLADARQRLGLPHVSAVVARVLQHSRNGRRTYLRARRTSLAAASHPQLAAADDQLQQQAPATATQQGAGPQHARLLLSAPPQAAAWAASPAASGFAAAAAHQPSAHQQQLQLHAAAGPGAAGLAWVAPQVQFTLGWYDPAEQRCKRGRRRRSFRQMRYC